MKHLLLFLLPLFCVNLTLRAQNASQPAVPAFIIFNMGENSLGSTTPHPAHLLACDTILFVDSLFWNTPGQIRDGLPYGFAKGSFRYRSKYYIASPPVFNGIPTAPGTIYNIGLVTPYEFWFEGNKPTQLVYMDYNVLQHMEIEYFPFSYDASFDEDEKVLVPFKVECANFPWSANSGVIGSEGAAGIGYFIGGRDSTDHLFLPFYNELQINYELNAGTKKYLDCKITLLNDILSDHDLHFVVNGIDKGESINLHEFAGKEVKIELKRIHKDEFPCGCKKQHE